MGGLYYVIGGVDDDMLIVGEIEGVGILCKVFG